MPDALVSKKNNIKKNNNIKTDKRAFELDFLRGLCIVMMILHHLIYDLRYIMELDVFQWQETWFFRNIVRFPFLFLFLFVSGICCVLSRNNLKRSGKYFLFSLFLSVSFYIFSKLTDFEMYFITNIIFVIAVGTLIYCIIQKIERKKSVLNVSALIVSMVIIIFVLWGMIYVITPDKYINIWLSPVHPAFNTGVPTVDHMPLIPWLSFFLIGALVGRKYYSGGTSPVKPPGPRLKLFLKPVEYIGRNSLAFYILHQPLMLVVLFGLRYLKII